jgi:hypothetical protein
VDRNGGSCTGWRRCGVSRSPHRVQLGARPTLNRHERQFSARQHGPALSTVSPIPRNAA